MADRLIDRANGSSRRVKMAPEGSFDSARSDGMWVAFVPVWRSNPYHTELKRALESLGVRVLYPDSLKQFGADCAVRREKPDVLHLHALPYLGASPISLGRYFLFHRRLSRLQKIGVRVVWTIHDFQNHDSRYWKVEDFVSRQLAGRLDGLIVHGEEAKRIVKSAWGPRHCRRTHVIPHGNYIESYRNEVSSAAARASLGLAESDFVFLFLGLIRPYKGVVEMVNAFRTCEGKRLRLIIAGRPVNDAIRAEVEQAIRGDSRIALFPGDVESDRIQVFMNASDVFVLPYLRVFTSGAAVLAMSFGKACIAPRVGCIPDMLDEQGAVLFDPEKDGDLLRAIREIYASRQRLAEMGCYNYQRATAWDWPNIGRRTAAVYRSCIASAGGGHPGLTAQRTQ